MSDEQISLWQAILEPICTALRMHTTVEQLAALVDEARRHDDAPPAVINVLQTLELLRSELDQL